jgi:hypothetical protein
MCPWYADLTSVQRNAGLSRKPAAEIRPIVTLSRQNLRDSNHEFVVGDSCLSFTGTVVGITDIGAALDLDGYLVNSFPSNSSWLRMRHLPACQI